jgi:hypothetical protein
MEMDAMRGIAIHPASLSDVKNTDQKKISLLRYSSLLEIASIPQSAKSDCQNGTSASKSDKSEQDRSQLDQEEEN